MGRTEHTDDRIAALQRVLARLAAPDVTLSEASSLRLEMQRLLNAPAPTTAETAPGPVGAGGTNPACYLRAAC